MRKFLIVATLLFVAQTLLGCALGRKEWPSAQKSEDRFSLELLNGIRQDGCLLLDIAVHGAANRLWRIAIQYESVGSEEGQGCSGCPFVPREVKEFTRESGEFNLQGSILKLGLCGLESGVEYRFRVMGTSELPAMPLESTDVYESLP
ncbi:hypothetical protein [Pseudodesulfovibrio portus]|uniref:Lipoprotein n=1 Tax=Pseudodesulfovibrio portus TaxID=231439 RepID=A0ABM8AMU0_9BACT|nr:hypothetical protein [Pseudodesulfovibrio portus]BDQ32690.1 hypothetical protein JCM14722_02320 [Pseudodesulfovibrio portus]